MTIELPHEIESQLEETAKSQGVSVSQYVERLFSETRLRQTQLSEFRAAIGARIASLEAGDSVDGEEVMASLISDLATR